MLNTFIQKNNIKVDNNFYKFMEKYIPKKMELNETESNGFIEDFIQILKTLVTIKEIKVENKKNIIVYGQKGNEEYVYTFKVHFDKKQIKIARLEVDNGVCVFNQKPSGKVERVFSYKDFDKEIDNIASSILGVENINEFFLTKEQKKEIIRWNNFEKKLYEGDK